MKDRNFRIGIAIVIIVLFIGSSFIPIINGNIDLNRSNYVNLNNVSSLEPLSNDLTQNKYSIPNNQTGTLIVTLESAPYKIIDVNIGEKDIEMEGFGSILIPGNPKLPSKTFLIGIPPGGKVLSVELLNENHDCLSGKYDITPAPPFASNNISRINHNSPISPKSSDIEKIMKYEINDEIYSSNDPYPSKMYEYLGMGQMRKYNFARINFYPVLYHPATGKLIVYNEITLKLEYKVEEKFTNELLSDNVMDDIASGIIENYPLIQNYYTPNISSNPLKSRNEEIYDYVIITTDALASSVMPLKNWKESIGYSVNVITTSWIFDHFSGDDLPEKIRNFLINKYISWGIIYVLIVGSHSSIPMRYCYPNKNDHSYNVPTDYYYADLTGNWDSDGDGYYGERDDDSVDFYPEVWVGRIPVDNPSKVYGICEKTVDYEQDDGTWKKNALLLGAISNFENEDGSSYDKTDNAELMEECWNDIYASNGYSRTAMYEKEGLDVSSYSCNYPLNKANVLTYWPTGYGIVNFKGHGYKENWFRKVWSTDDGDGVPEEDEITWPVLINTADCSSLNDDEPSIVFSCSCDNAFQEASTNLAKSFLENGAVECVATTRSGWYTVGWLDEGDGGIASIDYYFFKYLIDSGQKCGNALYNSKVYYVNNFDWWDWEIYENMYGFCLFGDPSIGATAVQENQPPTISITDISGITETEKHIFIKDTSKGNILKINGEATESYQGPSVDKIYIFIKRGEGTLHSYSGFATIDQRIGNQVYWHYNLDITKLNDGKYSIKPYCICSNGNLVENVPSKTLWINSFKFNSEDYLYSSKTITRESMEDDDWGWIYHTHQDNFPFTGYERIKSSASTETSGIIAWDTETYEGLSTVHSVPQDTDEIKAGVGFTVDKKGWYKWDYSHFRTRVAMARGKMGLFSLQGTEAAYFALTEIMDTTTEGPPYSLAEMKEGKSNPHAIDMAGLDIDSASLIDKVCRTTMYVLGFPKTGGLDILTAVLTTGKWSPTVLKGLKIASAALAVIGLAVTIWDVITAMDGKRHYEDHPRSDTDWPVVWLEPGHTYVPVLNVDIYCQASCHGVIGTARCRVGREITWDSNGNPSPLDVAFLPAITDFKDTYVEFITDEDPPNSITMQDTVKRVMKSSRDAIVVDNEGDGDYTNIQDAIDNSSDGDTIEVYSGKYYENITIDKEIDLLGIHLEFGNGTDMGNPIILLPPLYYTEVNKSALINLSSNNCTLNGINISTMKRPGYEAIKINSASNNTISNINISSCNYGIKIIGLSKNNHIYNNLITNSSLGMIISDSSENNSIYNNSISFCNKGVRFEHNAINNYFQSNIVLYNDVGIGIYSCSNNEFKGNLLFFNIDGITIFNSTNNHIEENYISASINNGLIFAKSDGNFITNNSFSYHGGIVIETYNSSNQTRGYSQIITGNTITQNISEIMGKTINYYYNQHGFIVPADSGQIILDHCSNVTINDQIISNVDYGIQLLSTSDVAISNCNISNSTCGIQLKYSKNITILNCSFGNNTIAGVFLRNSLGVRIFNNTFHSDGILMSGDTIKNLTNQEIENNYVNNKPIYYYKNQSSITVPTDAGQLIITNCSYFIVRNINISNVEYGIQISYSNNNIITGNNITNCTIGLLIQHDSNDNMIHHNRLINNSRNAIDNCSNTWDNGYPSGGNYWDDYTGLDANDDSIGDIYYNISGGNNSDNYPLGYFTNRLPVANFTCSPEFSDTSDVIQFNDTSYDLDGSIINWTWDFDDGNKSDYSNPTHQYSDDGIYIVNLTVADESGITNSTQKSIVINNSAPIADFLFGPSDPTIADVIHFYDFSYDSDGLIVNWTWNFGDGNISYGENQTYFYNDTGNFNVSLTVIDDDGVADSISKWIYISNITPWHDVGIKEITEPISDNGEEPESIHFDDGINSIGIGLTDGGVFEGAIRLTPSELAGFDEWNITKIKFFHQEIGMHSGKVKIYANGSLTSPGTLITSEPYIVTGADWHEITLSNPVIINASEDIWISVEVTHASDEYPLGVDIGPAVDYKGDWLSMDNGLTWGELQDYGIDRNWNIWAMIEEDALVNVLQQGTYPVEAVVKNYGGFNESFNVNTKIFFITKSLDVLFYEDDYYISNLLPDSEETIMFDDVIFEEDDLGTYRLETLTELIGDEYTINDREIITFIVEEFIDITPPVISNINTEPTAQEPGGWVNISCNVIDDVQVDTVIINITQPNGSYINQTMTYSNNNYFKNLSYSIPGTYNYFIWANDTTGNSNSSTIYTFEIISLFADFNYTPLNPDTADIIQFIDMSYDLDGYIQNWSWNFGDGGTSYLQNTTHQYTSNGIYTVTLVVTDNDANTADVSKGLLVGGIHITTISSNWNFVSLPFNLSMDKTSLVIKHGDCYYTWSQAATNSVVSDYLFGWSRSSQSYTFADTLEPGYGYWVYAYEPCEFWIENTTLVYDTYITDVEQNWNIISVPYDQSVNKANIIVEYLGTDYTWSEAVTMGLVSNYLFGWNRVSQSYGFADSLMPGYAYWMYAYQPCMLKRTGT